MMLISSIELEKDPRPLIRKRDKINKEKEKGGNARIGKTWKCKDEENREKKEGQH